MIEEKIQKMIEQRQVANFNILNKIEKVVKENPHLRFGQILANLGIINYEHDYINDVSIVKDPFHEESVTTLMRMKDMEK